MIVVIMGMFCNAQNIPIDYKLIKINAPCSNNVDSSIQKTIDREHRIIGKKISQVIGYCPETLQNFMPQSPLTNLCTDMLFKCMSEYCSENRLEPIDLSLLNFGCFRNILPAGDITVKQIYEISPFDNHVVIIDIKGDELAKIFKAFTTKKNLAYSNNVHMEYIGDYPTKILVNGEAIDKTRIYRITTSDFIAQGGDGILEDVKIEKFTDTSIRVRNVYIDGIKKMTAKKQTVSAKIDDRVIILPQPQHK